jgi:hypothetical protein
MGLFDKSKPETPAAPKTNGTPAPDTQAPDRMAEIRNLSGFNSLDDVARTAEDMVRDSAKRSADKRNNRLSPKQKEEAEAAAKAAKRQQALETLGKFFCRELTVIPYDAWSKFYSDPALRLSPEEAQKLTEATFLVVQGFDIDFSSPWIGLLGLVLMHSAAIGHRIQHLAAMGVYDDDKKKKDEQKEKVQ